MKNIKDIKNTSGLKIIAEGEDGFAGIIYTKVSYKNGKPKFENELFFIFSTGCSFEHLSVSTLSRCPTWEEMCYMKDVFWNDDEVCMQLHPKKEEYVNNHDYCLHIWKPINQEIPTPPSVLIGIRKSHELEDVEKMKELRKEIYSQIKKE